MKKRVLAMLMALVMVFGLAACGSAGEQPNQPNQPDQSQSNPEESNAPTKTDTLKIGLLVHTTGWFAAVDTPNYNEFNAMVQYINNNGGWVVGDTAYTLEAVCVDGASDYAALNTAALSLVDAGVDFVVETNDFWVNSVANVFEEEGIMHVSAYCVLAPGYITPEYTMSFTGGNGAAGDYSTAFAALAEHYPHVKTVVMCENDNGNIDITFPVVKAAAAEYGITVLEEPIIYPGDTTDYTTVANQLVATGADAFLGAGAPDAYGAILKAVRAMGSDMVCACCQGKPATTLMEYAGAEASSNAFTLGPSTRESDKDQNTDILNAVVAQVAEMYGAETAATFDGAAANCLYILLQMMQRSGSVDPEVVAAEWAKGGTVDTIYGNGIIGGEATYGVPNHAVGSPRSVSIIDPKAEGGWYFAGWVDTLIP